MRQLARLEARAGSVASIEIPADWAGVVKADPLSARNEQLRVRSEFQQAFSSGLVCAGFHRDAERPSYLLYEKQTIDTALE